MSECFITTKQMASCVIFNDNQELGYWTEDRLVARKFKDSVSREERSASVDAANFSHGR